MTNEQVKHGEYKDFLALLHDDLYDDGAFKNMVDDIQSAGNGGKDGVIVVQTR